ncbi:MAG: hypothetical protein U1E51_31140, partial [Candidatus Binatia bacterium]|nr:hypothetical protein [Candidatus Binatia bacterium]
MCEGYARQELPGDPLEAVTQLRDRLNEVIRIVAAQQGRDDVSSPSRTKMAQAQQAAEAAGVTRDQWTQFIEREGESPGCYEKTCWWLKKVTKTFGPLVGEAVKAVMLD